MKKLIFLLLCSVTMFGQVSTGSEQYFDYGIQVAPTSLQIPTTVNYVGTFGTDGTQGRVLPQNVTIPQVPLNYSVLTQTIGGHLAGIDTKLGTIVATTAGNTTRVWFTADVSVVSATNYYATNATGKGTLASAIQNVVNNDNEKKYFTQDLIGAPFAQNTLFPPGVYAGNLSASTSPNSAQQRWTVELYKCNNAGVPIASGVTGAVIGSLGVTVVTILDSGLLTLADGSVTNVQVSGNLGTGGFSIATGERIRYHVSAEKFGTAGANITQSIYYGTSYNSFLDVPVPLNTSGVQNLSNVTGITTTEALNNLYASIPVNYSKIVYVNNVNPNSATIFDLNNPPTVNDNALKSDVANLYIGTDASGWVYNSTSLTYVSKSVTGALSNNAIPKSSAAGLINSTISDTGTAGMVNINNFIGGSVTRVLPIGNTSIGQTISLTQTNATSRFINRLVVNHNEDGIASTLTNTGVFEVSQANFKSTNQPSVSHVTAQFNLSQQGSGTLNSIRGVISNIGGSGTGAVTTMTNFEGAGTSANTYPITNFYGFNIFSSPQNNVTNAYGFRVGNLFGSTISRAFDSSVSSGVGQYNIYSQGTASNYFASNVLVGTSTSNGNAFRLTGTMELITPPTTSAGTFDILTRNTSTGVVEKVLNSDFSHLAGAETFTGTKSFRANSPLGTIFDVDNTVGNKGINMQQRAGGNTTGIYNINYSTGYSMDLWKDVGGGASGDNVKIRSNVTGASNLILDYNSVTGGNTNLDIRNNGATTATISNLGNIVANSYSGGATLTGTPTAPTATIGTNTTQIATTAFVQANSTSGSYTPTLTAIANCSSLVLEIANYTKVGNVVSVKVFITGTATSASALTEISFPLPVNKSVATNKKVGTFNIYSNSSVGGSVGYVVSNQTTATLSAFNSASSGSNFYFIADFQYDITQ